MLVLKCETCLYYSDCCEDIICDDYVPMTAEMEEKMLIEREELEREEFFNEYYEYIDAFYND